jgi:hypothetical protein
MVVAFVVGGAIAFLAFTQLDEYVNDQVDTMIPSA